MKRIFNAKIEANKPQIVFGNREDFDEYVKSLCRDKDTHLKITVEKQKSKRTNNQNAFYWVCLNVISSETGQDADTLHDTFKAMFLKKQVKVGNKLINVVGSTTDLGKMEFSEYMDKIGAFISDFGIILPSPDNYDI